MIRVPEGTRNPGLRLRHGVPRSERGADDSAGCRFFQVDGAAGDLEGGAFRALPGCDDRKHHMIQPHYWLRLVGTTMAGQVVKHQVRTVCGSNISKKSSPS